MPAITIKGSVWPRGKTLTLPSLVFTVTNQDTGVTSTFRCSCDESVVSIICEAPDLMVEDANSLGLIVSHARMMFDGAVSLASVRVGRPGKFIPEQIVADGIEGIINIEQPLSSGIASAFTKDEFIEIIQSIGADTEILLILQDMNYAMLEPYYSLVGCGRAIDGIRHAIAGPGGDPGVKKWPEFNQALNVDKSYPMAIMSASIRARHGQRLVNHGHDVNDVMNRTWVLFDRFMSYRKLGNVPLTAPEFPLLTG